MFGNCNGLNNFSMGINPGMGMMPGSSVKITQTTSGFGNRGSIFGTPRFGGCCNGFGGSSSTTIEYNNGLNGFWGGAAGFLSGLTGRFSTGWNNMCGGFNNMFGGGMFGGGMMGGGVGNITPYLMQGINLGNNTVGGSSTSPATVAKNNLETMGKGSGWTVVQNPDGTFYAKLPADKAESGKDEICHGDYDTVMEKILNTKTKEPTPAAETDKDNPDKKES